MNESVYKEDAKNYDDSVREYGSYAHDIIFGMSYEFVKRDEKLLDIGIGTGLASIKFSDVGLKVYGLDASEEMLNACRSKSFAEELKLYNILNGKIPYSEEYFDHVVCCGVLHFIGDLEKVFSEVSGVIKKGGIFAFTIVPQETEKEYVKQMTAWGVPIFKHSSAYVKRLLNSNRMELLKEQRLLIKGADKINYDMMFSVMLVKCL